MPAAALRRDATPGAPSGSNLRPISQEGNVGHRRRLLPPQKGGGGAISGRDVGARAVLVRAARESARVPASVV